MKDTEIKLNNKKGQIKFRVRYADTDRMGVVYNGKYFEYLEVGRTEFMRELGITYADIEDQGIGLVVVEANIKYRASATYDDIVCVECWVKNVTRSSVTFEYVVLKNDTIIVEAETTLVSIDIQKHKAMKLPEKLDTILKDNLVSKK